MVIVDPYVVKCEFFCDIRNGKQTTSKTFITKFGQVDTEKEAIELIIQNVGHFDIQGKFRTLYTRYFRLLFICF